MIFRLDLYRFVFLGFALTSSCGDLELEQQSFQIRMLGVFQDPYADQELELPGEGFEPISQSYSLRDVVLIENDTETEYRLATGDIAEEFRVVNQSQIIFEKTINNLLIGKEMSALRITFSNSASGRSQSAKHLFLLDNELDEDEDFVLEYNTIFYVKKGLNLTFRINVLWKNTLRKTFDEDGEIVEESLLTPVLEVEKTRT